MGLEATVLVSTDLDHFHHHGKFRWTVLLLEVFKFRFKPSCICLRGSGCCDSQTAMAGLLAQRGATGAGTRVSMAMATSLETGTAPGTGRPSSFHTKAEAREVGHVCCGLS